MPVFIIYTNIVRIYYTHALLRERTKYFPFLGNWFRPYVLHIVRLRSEHTGGKLMFSRMPFFFFFLGKIRLNAPVFPLLGAKRGRGVFCPFLPLGNVYFQQRKHGTLASQWHD